MQDAIALKELFEKQKKGEVEKQEDTEEILQFIGFIIGSEEYAIPILNILEIVKPIGYTRVPETPNYVLGVFNLRGNVFPLISLRLKFGLSAEKLNKDMRYLVVRHKDQIAGFFIDRLTEAIRIKQSDIDPVPETLLENNQLIYGIGKREDKLVSILKVEEILKKDF
ncbi:chemotaxis protein CheW [Helicobacter ailurogastricus]|uniref:Positive regulator of CheA protein activity (CheW) n=1 Tax=Helicobacter ailurogastricus TaxID=1578720 RepID=A0A0K2XGK6_9HELI|nr:chemotaxis protein CheW [Helicobacter ailurogastricus]CRF40524.1 Positive regulator of CheA protein activity (CheW) [Helicobacter ailurogastricus]CRF41948.1 Positive regulator of CheA protein activity (CheW) [Helicobacter ailurogastricus]CRF44743.1 Positive regulator of CheA protein activity (CheW) [Helicobacter ailurogastricus]CRF53052.1 Positive regulator of CheA protein activity (CheW) [Helicobacter ailurogastricus]BDQ28524.1 chemotaxis protein CheW [Helicobacter ailurogastricus]